MAEKKMKLNAQSFVSDESVDFGGHEKYLLGLLFSLFG